MGTKGKIPELGSLKEREEKIAQHRKVVAYRHYDDIAAARDKGIPVAYMSGVIPPEICYAMGVQPCMPENYVTICCAKQMAEKYCEAAESRGISRDVCSYARVGLGMMWLEDGPYGALPKPDFVLGNPLGCEPNAKWFEIAATHFQVPLLLVDGPFRFRQQIEEHELVWMVSEVKKVFTAIEQITGNRLDYDRLKEVMRLSSQARELFGEINEYRKTSPCPRGLREIVRDLFYLVTQLGTQEAVDYFTMVRDEVKERVAQGTGVVPQEKFRLIWDNIPPWYRLQLLDYFSQRGAVFAIDSYPTTYWTGFHFDGGHLDSEKPLQALALIHLSEYHWRSLNLQMKGFERMVREWHCDGAVFFSNRGCQILSRGVPEKERIFREKTGALSMSFEAEMADPRSLDEAQVKSKIDSFLETLEQRKARTDMPPAPA